MNIKFDTALICEDVRREENGKLGLAGVFSTDIVVDRFPAVLVLSFLLVATVKVAIESEVSIRLRLDDVNLFEGKGRMSPSYPGRTLLPIGRQVLKIEKLGILRLDVKQAGANWQNLSTTPIRSADIVPEQPPRPRHPKRNTTPASRKVVKRGQKPRSLLH